MRSNRTQQQRAADWDLGDKTDVINSIVDVRYSSGDDDVSVGLVAEECGHTRHTATLHGAKIACGLHGDTHTGTRITCFVGTTLLIDPALVGCVRNWLCGG